MKTFTVRRGRIREGVPSANSSNPERVRKVKGPRKIIMIDGQGRAIVQVCSSMPAEEHTAACAVADELGLSLSAMIRVALRQFAGSVHR